MFLQYIVKRGSKPWFGPLFAVWPFCRSEAMLRVPQWLFSGIFVQKIFKTNAQLQVSIKRIYEKVQPSCGQLLKLKQQKCHYFFESLTLWSLKLRFLSYTFRSKTYKNSHYGTRTLLLVPTTKSQSRVHTRARLCFLILAWFSMSFLLSTSYYFYGNNTLSSPTLAQVNTNSICEGKNPERYLDG